MFDLSILIPARNEMFLAKTVEDLLTHIEAKTEIIVVEDGGWSNPGIPQHELVSIIHHSESVGQRAATNEAARLASGKYLMKVDAHCAFDQGFDRKMLEAIQPDWTMVPTMRNLHVFDWVCPDGHRRYQGKSGSCEVCGKDTTRDIVWIPKTNPSSNSYCFDSTPHFQYFREFTKRPEGKGDLTETMSLQGSCWMLSRDKYWELDICDESFGSWGSQGIEVAVKTWLSGGRVMVNHNTWYAHLFRTQGGDFGFPYPLSGHQVNKAKTHARELFFNDNWPKQVRPLSWLVEKFWPVPGWSDDDLAKLKANTFTFSGLEPDQKTAESEPVEIDTVERSTFKILYDSSSSNGLRKMPTKGIIYYTDNQLNVRIAYAVKKQLKKISEAKKIPIVSASLKKMDFGVKNIYFPSLKKGYLAMFKQILGALENSTADIIFFAEHDVYYSEEHFDFTPPEKNIFYYNQNVWFLRTTDGHALHYDVNQLSGLCAYREALITHFRERYEMVKEEYEKGLPEADFVKFVRNIGFEPMTHGRIKWNNVYKYEGWQSARPNIDLRHAGNATGQRWHKDQYRNQKLLINWTEADGQIPGWGNIMPILNQINGSQKLAMKID